MEVIIMLGWLGAALLFANKTWQIVLFTIIGLILAIALI